MTESRIIVVGGGLIGLLTARELLMAGRSVRLYERGRIGRESSWAGGGILSSLHPWRVPAVLEPLIDWSQQEYPLLAESLLASTGIDPEWRRSGLLIVGQDDVNEAADWASRAGIAWRRLEGEGLKAAEPALSPPGASTVLLPDIAQIRNPRLLQALFADLERRGLECRSGIGVEAIWHEDGRVHGVRSELGDDPAEAVVVCSGAWTSRLVDGLGQGFAAGVRPVRGQMLLYKAEAGWLRHILLDADRYIIPRRDGHILVGSTVEDAGFEKSVTLEAFADLKAEAGRLLPGLSESEPVAHWAGLRPGRKDGVPLIGPVSAIEGLYVNAGHYRNGVLLGPASARLLVDGMLGRASFCDASLYTPR